MVSSCRTERRSAGDRGEGVANPRHHRRLASPWTSSLIALLGSGMLLASKEVSERSEMAGEVDVGKHPLHAKKRCHRDVVCVAETD